MEEFSFYQDIKCVVWNRQNFVIKADSYEEAEEIAKEYINKDVSAYEDVYQEKLINTEEVVKPENNGGFATIEVFNEYDELIGSNEIK